MLRLRLGSLLLITALVCSGCIVATDTPSPPTPALITATAPTAPPATPASPSATAITIVTATPSVWAPVPDTPTPLAPSATLPPSNPPPSETPLPAMATSTLIASETSTAAAPGDTPPATVPPVTPSPATPSPAATALPVGIASFTISPPTINPGDTITLTWQATGEQAAIYRLEPGGPPTDMHTVPLSGTLVLQTSAALRNQVSYVLYAGAGGSTASATVSAVIQCPDKWFFAQPPAGCPSGPGTLISMAAERFEHGLMIWVSGQDRIYILFGDGASPGWSAQSNGWFAGQPEMDPSLTPPAGLFQPVRGFGFAWRASNATFGMTVRERLGWATEPEAALTGGYQCDSAAKYNHCYLSGPGGAVYHLLPEFSGWQVWHGP